MRSRIVLALMTVVVGLQSASAIDVGLDTVVVFNPLQPIASDGFNDGMLDPMWAILSGSPGPESGETLEMHGGDSIFRALKTNREADLTAYSRILLTDFPPGSFVSMILHGQKKKELKSIAINMTPGEAFLVDETGAILASTLLPPSSEANLLLTLTPHGPGLLGVTATVDDVTFTDKLKVDFGTVTGIEINVVPEPATLGLLGLGCLVMCVRHLRRTRH